MTRGRGAQTGRSMMTLLTVGILLLAAILVAGGFLVVRNRTQAPARAADAWFELLQQGHFAEAHALATPDFQRASSAQALAQEATRAALAGAAPPSWSDREINPGTAILAGNAPRPEGGSQIAVMLANTGDTWRVHSVLISPMVGRQMRRFIDIRTEGPGFKLVANTAAASTPH